MASETVDPIDWSHPPPSWAVPPELHVLHSVNVAYKSQDLLQQPGVEHASKGMPDQRTTCAATHCIRVDTGGSPVACQPYGTRLTGGLSTVQRTPHRWLVNRIRHTPSRWLVNRTAHASPVACQPYIRQTPQIYGRCLTDDLSTLYTADASPMTCQPYSICLNCNLLITLGRN